MNDILFCITPHYDSEMPSIALPILNSIAKQNGYRSKLIDFNLDLYYQYNEIFDGTIQEWTNVDTIFSPTREIKSQKLIKLLDKWTEQIINHVSKYVAFSALSSFNYVCIIELAKRLKKYNKKIIVGGVSAQWFKTYIEQNNYEDLIDHIVIGYGESVILDILSGTNTNKIIESPTIDFSTNVIPDYTDLDLSKYTFKGLFLSTSRGCIYNCSFCHVKYIWKDFVQRPIPFVIEEMEYMRNKYNINFFKSTDSIINAVMPRYRKLCFQLKDKGFKWDAMFSIRNKVMKDNDYKLLSEAGCELLFIGVESGSQKVRNDMGKKFTDDDLYSTLDSLEKYGIKACLMFITGYPTENQEDFELTKKLIYDLKQRNYSIISSVRSQFLSTVNLPELEKMHNENYNKRYDRYNELRDFIDQLGFRVKQDKRLKKWVEGHYTTQ